MTTRLDGPLKREISIDGVDYTLTIGPQGMTLTVKGRRKGFDLEWKNLVSGDAAMATALNASLTANLEPTAHAQPAADARPAARRTRSTASPANGAGGRVGTNGAASHRVRSKRPTATKLRSGKGSK